MSRGGPSTAFDERPPRDREMPRDEVLLAMYNGLPRPGHAILVETFQARCVPAAMNVIAFWRRVHELVVMGRACTWWHEEHGTKHHLIARGPLHWRCECGWWAGPCRCPNDACKANGHDAANEGEKARAA